ncbi:hypothetical protein [Leifsonia sp. 2MCAF36]|uniref:hypothetical protein n=1 Tax=Leifsonia sp. 2MCAF36 TaxID=3232988 RepID=UPI003F95101F
MDRPADATEPTSDGDGNRRRVHLRRRQGLAVAAVVVYLAALLFAAATHQPAGNSGYGTTVVGKHHDGPDWQLDLISGRRSWTIHVDHSEYDSYRLGDSYNER